MSSTLFMPYSSRKDLRFDGLSFTFASTSINILMPYIALAVIEGNEFGLSDLCVWLLKLMR